MKFDIQTYDFNKISPDGDRVLILGTFDGMHRGHRELIHTARTAGVGAVTELFTFINSPKSVLAGSAGVLMTFAEKLECARKLGVDRVCGTVFDEKFAAVSAEEFFDMITSSGRVKHIVVGYDYTFGAGAAGNVELLGKMAEKRGIEMHVVMPVTDENNEPVSSTAIRTLIGEGKVEQAEKRLGQPYALGGIVRDGNHVGRTIGFPTANVVPPEEKIIPACGVYATLAYLDGKEYYSVTDIGTAPTVRTDGGVKVECHMLGYTGDAYSKYLTIRFIRRIRDEKKLGSLDELRAQLENDKLTAKAILDIRRKKSELGLSD